MTKVFYFLLIFLVTGIPAGAQDLREMRLSGEPQKSETEIVSRRDNNGNFTAAIMVISDMEGFSYDAYNGVVGNVDSRPGMDLVYVQATERVLEIYKTGYRPLKIILSEVGISLRPQEVWQITVTGDAPPAATLPVTIRITPADAVLTINGKPASGTTHPLTPGSHTLKIEKEGFKTEEKTITVSEQQVFFEFALTRQPYAGLQIETTPAGATVYLEEVLLGVSPFSVWYKPGTYPIRIVKEGYVTLENQTLEVALPQTRKSYTLEENVGYLTINTHSGASVYFNDQLIANPKNVKLPPQLVKVKVTQPKAEPLEQQVVLKRNDRLTFDLYPQVQTGTIQIAVTPFDAQIELTGDAGEKFTATGMKVFEDIPVGRYDLRVNAIGFETTYDTVNLQLSQLISKEISLESKTENFIDFQNKNIFIGDRLQGGIVFYLDSMGGGLVFSDHELGNAIWGCDGTYIGRTSKSFGKGSFNSGEILKNCSNESTAAMFCNDLVLNGFDDWYLPSIDELSILFKKLYDGEINFKLNEDIYWSSTEIDKHYAWGHSLYSSAPPHSFYKNYPRRVIAIRNFTAENAYNELIVSQLSVVNNFGIKMVYVEGGTFIMGCTPETNENCSWEEKPAHEVTLGSYYIGIYEVTQQLWRAIMGTDPKGLKFTGCTSCPVEGFSMKEMAEFIEKLNFLTGKDYRLPTEAEWEFAARGGNYSKNYLYSGGNNIDQVAWHLDNSNWETHPVGVKLPNELGIYDMSGNVWELCLDQMRIYTSDPQTNPIGPITNYGGIVRGGSYSVYPYLHRVSNRTYYHHISPTSNIGFRLVHFED